MTDCEDVQWDNLVTIGSLIGLERLFIDGVGVSDDSFDESRLSTLTSLRLLNMDYCAWSVSLSPLVSGMSHLWSLSLHGCGSPSLAPLMCLASTLAYLDIGGNDERRSLAPLSALTGLVSLSLRESPDTVDLSPLSTLTNLKHLDLSDCQEWIGDMKPLRGLAALKLLNLKGNFDLEAVAPIAGPRSDRRDPDLG